MSDETRPYLVIDTETSIKNRGEDAVGSNKAAPWHPDNKVVYSGWTYEDYGDLCKTCEKIPRGWIKKGLYGCASLVIGQNIAFDLHYLRKEDAFDVDSQAKILIWDTQLAEYVLTGQQEKFASLDKLATKYGGTIKDDKMKAYWDANVDTEDIPEEDILPYLKEDVKNTELAFLHQVKLANADGMVPLIQMLNESLLATTDMEYNGMYFDVDLAKEIKKDLELEYDSVEKYLAHIMGKCSIYLDNPSSNKQISTALFGGEIEYDRLVPMEDSHGIPIKYKTGKKAGSVRMKKQRRIDKVNGFGIVPLASWETANKGVYSVNDNVLKTIKDWLDGGKIYPDPTLDTFINELLRYRQLSKDLKTYYEGFLKLVWPDGRIHGNINNTSTNTGRLSSSSPNLQNLTSEK